MIDYRSCRGSSLLLTHDAKRVAFKEYQPFLIPLAPVDTGFFIIHHAVHSDNKDRQQAYLSSVTHVVILFSRGSVNYSQCFSGFLYRSDCAGYDIGLRVTIDH